ncbi:HAD family hydrolase [Companilactobacillus farciminis]|nr:HAD family hydrolase [Companilactobacillus farciminis]
MKNTILFDVDGTLIDTEKTIIKSFQKTLQDTYGITPKAEELFYVLGIPGTKAIEKYAHSEIEGQKLLTDWNENDHAMFHYSEIFDGIERALKQLKQRNIKLGIVTSRTDSEMQVVLDNFDIGKYFDIFITASKTKLHKPNPDPILKAMKILNLSSQDTMYVGDSIYDFQCARNAGIEFGLASWGAKENPEFAKVDYYLQVPTDLTKVIQKS